MLPGDLAIRPQLVEYFVQYLNDRHRLEHLLNFALDGNLDNTPRQMPGNVQSLVSLADDIDQVRPNRPCLKVLFIATCIESLYKLANRDCSTPQILLDFFTMHVLPQDQALILDNIRKVMTVP